MKKTYLMFIAFLILISNTAIAINCQQSAAELKNKIYKKYQIENLRAKAVKIRNVLSADEISIFKSLSLKFKSIPADSDENLRELYALQAEAKKLVRTAVQRAGFKILNSEQNSPFDALIAEVSSSDNYPEYAIEVRSLLKLDDVFPHITLWAYRYDKLNNPFHMISIGVTLSADSDYASWKKPDSTRGIGSFNDFIIFNLPSECSNQDAL